MYCNANHYTKNILCNDCELLKTYALLRIDHCVYGLDKPSCNKCPVHCYSVLNREKIKVVMIYSGKRMIWKHPYLSILHMLKRNPKSTKKIS